jgi:IMP and pyridine-specific 5'-nucleotidase
LNSSLFLLVILIMAEVDSERRNCVLSSLRKDSLIEWMKEMLNHSFVLDAQSSYPGTMKYFEKLINEHRDSYSKNGINHRSHLKEYVPSVGRFHTSLPLSTAFSMYDAKYSISKRRFISPTFNEIRHILNLSQVMAIGNTLRLITFDGDQTLYSDGGNFEQNEELAMGIMSLMCHGIKVAVVTAAGYGLDGTKYAKRLQGLLDRFLVENLSKEQVENFYVFGGECNYLLQCTLEACDGDDACVGLSQDQGHGESPAPYRAVILPVPTEAWQAPQLQGPKPTEWAAEDIKHILDVAEESMRGSVAELNLRAKVHFTLYVFF